MEAKTPKPNCDPTALSFEPLLAWLTNLMKAYKSENPLVN